MTDINVLSIGFLSSILMLIFMQTMLLFKLPHFIYVPSITSLRYNVNHSCASISLISTFPIEFMAIASSIPLISHYVPSFPVFHCTSLSIFDSITYSTN